ncbi:MAG TPA: methylenetetrahydrofolate reductase C-terminal domain-containing protein [Solirubrobacteraceae bacterium]|nr:methylenetetrahydrofolate reductase C-terminal domain-containing protein [Solirubrobacteraceae bacterium]
MATLREKLAWPDAFVIAAELVTSRGVLEQHSGKALVELAHALAENPRIDVLSLTDNPGGNPMIAPDMLANRMREIGQEVILHFACKDMNRNGIESRAWKAASAGLDNILALSGDYPIAGQSGTAAPVFDIDSVGLLSLLSDMNAGVQEARAPDGRLLSTNFHLGCVVTNHKLHEREVMPQYFKLEKKVRAGARFCINQIGWNARKDDELLRWVTANGLELKLIANVYLLTRGVARVFHSGRIPGVVVSDELLAQAERYGGGEDKGREFFLDLAAKQVAVARGLGFAGAYIGGHMPPERYDEILDRAALIEGEQWREAARELHYDRPGEFYLYGHDPESGLSDGQVREEYLQSRRARRTDLPVPARYRLSRVMHNAVFAQDAPLFPLGTRVYRRLEEGPKSLARAAHVLEQAAKVPMFGCKDCGDCSLPDIAYVCPEGPCAKNQRNGPCGGTRDGLCEVYDSECIWAQAYERLKAYGEELELVAGPVVIKDNALRGTSAWANTFLGRDHNARAARHENQTTEEQKER